MNNLTFYSEGVLRLNGKGAFLPGGVSTLKIEKNFISMTRKPCERGRKRLAGRELSVSFAIKRKASYWGRGGGRGRNEKSAPFYEVF